MRKYADIPKEHMQIVSKDEAESLVKRPKKIEMTDEALEKTAADFLSESRSDV